FLDAIGYSLAEIQGKHHSMFVETSERNSQGYRDFWDSLNRGQFQAAEYKRIAKGGREIWIQASYNPILDLNASRSRSSSTQPTSPPRRSGARRLNPPAA